MFATVHLKTKVDLIEPFKIPPAPVSLPSKIILSPEEKMQPKLSSEIKPDGKMISKPLEDMFPFVDREEFKRNMIISVINEWKKIY